jgi:hypothetical protein
VNRGVVRGRPDVGRYDPWRDLRENWPEVQVVIKPMRGRLLGELRYPVIALRADTTAAQRRCTLAHEIVHLERGVTDCGPWAEREERLVEAEAARRLIPTEALLDAVRSCGGAHDIGALADVLEVDLDTLEARLRQVTPRERQQIETGSGLDLWSVA